MSTFLNGAASVINYVIDMGASVMLPIVISILSIIIGVKVGKAIRSGLMIGVGFVGMGVIVDMMNNNMGPAAKAMAGIGQISHRGTNEPADQRYSHCGIRHDFSAAYPGGNDH